VPLVISGEARLILSLIHFLTLKLSGSIAVNLPTISFLQLCGSSALTISSIFTAKTRINSNAQRVQRLLRRFSSRFQRSNSSLE
jgi:hypothetical protein